MASDPDQLERLRQLELEINQPSPIERPSPKKSQSPQAPQPDQGSRLSTLIDSLGSWGQILVIGGGILACVLAVGLFFRLFGQLLQLGLVLGLGAALYYFVVAPRLGLKKKPDVADTQGDEPPPW